MRIVAITGVAGNIGSKLRRHLTARSDLRLRLLDQDPHGDPSIVPIDLAAASARQLTELLEGVETVIHLAAERNAFASWAELRGPNVDAVLSLYLAASQASVRRIVLASSMFAVRALQDGGPIPAGEPDPGDNPYGATKLFAERIGRAFAEPPSRISTVVLRIGACGDGDNLPPPRFESWYQRSWTSNSDVCIGIERALDLPEPGFHVFNLVSNLPSGSWELEDTLRRLGTNPQVQEPSPTPRVSLLRRLARRFRRLLKQLPG